jgi:hypothetical protein
MTKLVILEQVRQEVTLAIGRRQIDTASGVRRLGPN